MPLIVVCKGLEVPPYLIQRANECQVPVLRTTQSTTPFIHSLTLYLDHMFAPQTTVHGSLVDVYGVRAAVHRAQRRSASRRCALDLVERGHRLVADDVVTITRRHGDVLIGTGNQLLRHHMEIRGLGIIDVQSIFGIRSIRLQKRVEVQVNLHEWSERPTTTSASGSTSKTVDILGVEIPLVAGPDHARQEHHRDRRGHRAQLPGQGHRRLFAGRAPEPAPDRADEAQERRARLGARGHRVMSRVPALLVTHADLAEALLRAAERVYGPVEDVDRLSNDGYSRENLEREIAARVERWPAGGLVLIDFWGGSCFTCGMSCRARPRGRGSHRASTCRCCSTTSTTATSTRCTSWPSACA